MSPSIHVDYIKKDILILDKVSIDGLGDTALSTEKEYYINFTKEQKKFCLSCIYFALQLNEKLYIC